MAFEAVELSAGTPIVWPRARGSSRTQPSNNERKHNLARPATRREQPIQIHQDALRLPVRFAAEPGPTESTPPPGIPQPRQALWSKLASLDALLDPSPAVVKRAPLQDQTNRVVQQPRQPAKEKMQAVERDSPGVDLAREWRKARSRPWLDKLRRELNIAYGGRDDLPSIGHRLRPSGTISILSHPGQPVLIDLREQTGRALLIADRGASVSVFSHLGPGPLVLLAPSAVYSHATLPSAYGRAYMLAVKFVEGLLGRLPKIIFFPTPPASNIAARCTVFRSGAFTVAISTQLDSPPSFLLSVRVDRAARKLALTRSRGEAAEQSSASDKTSSHSSRAVTHYSIPETDDELDRFDGLRAAERELLRWILEEVEERAVRLLAELKKAHNGSSGGG